MSDEIGKLLLILFWVAIGMAYAGWRGYEWGKADEKERRDGK